MADVLIEGVLVDEATGGPPPALTVEALDAQGTPDVPFGRATSDARGHFQIRIDDRLREQLARRQTQVYLLVRSKRDVVADSRDQDVFCEPRQPNRLELKVPHIDEPERPPAKPYEVRGQVVTGRGTPAEGVTVEVWDHRLRGATPLGSGVPDGQGNYRVLYDPARLDGKALGDIEVRVVDGRQKELARSKVAYQAPTPLEVDLVVAFTAVARPTEYERLLAGLAPLLDGSSLTDVDAGGVVFLANRSGWDPRSVAMAAEAARVSARTDLPAAHYYALFRSGAAPDAAAAHRLPDTMVVRTIEAALAEGIIPDSGPIDVTIRRHQAQAVKALRSYVPPGGVSSVDQMLDLRLNASEKNMFVDRLRATADDPERLWDELARAGMSPGVVRRLQTDGQLAHLTLQNAPLMARLVDRAGVETTTDLVPARLYESGAWTELIGDDVPAGLNPESYAVGLAAHVRLAYPTLVTADLVRRDRVAVGGRDVAGRVADFLVEAGPDHQLGRVPVVTWPGFDELTADVRDGLRTVERLYQITPSDGAMETLSRLGIGSARQIAQYSSTEFLATHGKAFPTMAQAALVHQKAQEVHGAAVTLATAYITRRGAPHVYALDGPSNRRGPSVESTPATATLENLFGNLDYCACEHCKSVLGPAAYLVDLLEFLDLTDVAHDLANPLTVLLERRPDLQHILLTCENTNVALPYIDIVNEILEHFIVNGNLDDFEGHDTAPGTSTADLLVDPEFVEANAYVGPAAAVFPHPLPFHMPLEALRLQFEVWDVSLAGALELFGTPAESRRETLGLNPDEFSIFTNTAFRTLPEYFGVPAAATIAALNAAVANAKVLCRRLDVAYMDLHRILQTRFVNPGTDLVPALEGLRVGLLPIQAWYAGDLTDAELLDLLPDDLDTGPYAGDVVAWLTANQAVLRKLITLTPTGAPAPGDPPLDDCDFAGLELKLALADPAADALTPLEFHRLHRFIRLWKKLNWSIEATDELVTRFLPTAPGSLSVANIDASFTTLLARAANFLALMAERSVSTTKFGEWLSLFDAADDPAARGTRLAKLLGLGSVDFADLVEMSGIDPLADDMEAVTPSLLRFVRAWGEIKASPVKVADLDYLLRHGDPTGKLDPTAADLHTQIRTLRDALTAVDATLGTTPDSADLAYAQAKMALVYDAAVVARFFGLVGRSTTYDAPLLTSEETLPKKLTDVTAALGFDPFKKRLSFAGTMAVATRTALDAAADSLVLADVEIVDTQPELDAFIAAVKAAVAAAKAAGDADVAALHADYAELGTVYDAAAAVVADPAAQAKIVLDGILPALRARLKASAIRTGLASLLKVDQGLVDAITAGPGVLHANSVAADGVLVDLLGVELPVALDHDQVATLHVDPQASDDFNLYVAAPAGTQVTLAVDGAAVIAAGPVPAGGEVGTSAALPLLAGTSVVLELTIAGLPAGTVAELRWRTKGMAKVAIPASRVTADARMTEATASLRRIGKVVLLQRLLGLTPREVRFLASTAPDTRGFLDDLPVAATAAPVVLWDKVARLIWFTALKRETEPDPDTWVAAFGDDGPGRRRRSGPRRHHRRLAGSRRVRWPDPPGPPTECPPAGGHRSLPPPHTGLRSDDRPAGGRPRDVVGRRSDGGHGHGHAR